MLVLLNLRGSFFKNQFRARVIDAYITQARN